MCAASSVLELQLLRRPHSSHRLGLGLPWSPCVAKMGLQIPCDYNKSPFLPISLSWFQWFAVRHPDRSYTLTVSAAVCCVCVCVPHDNALDPNGQVLSSFMCRSETGSCPGAQSQPVPMSPTLTSSGRPRGVLGAHACPGASVTGAGKSRCLSCHTDLMV